MIYIVFSRTWWKRSTDPRWRNLGTPYDGLEPHMGRASIIARNVPTEESARDMCRVWNANHAPGKLGRKAEYRQA